MREARGEGAQVEARGDVDLAPLGEGRQKVAQGIVGVAGGALEHEGEEDEAQVACGVRGDLVDDVRLGEEEVAGGQGVVAPAVVVLARA